MAITISLFGPKDIKKAFFARSIGEAADSCEEKINSEYGKTLISKYYDQISSRYEPDFKQYIIYYRISHSTTVDNLPTVQNMMVKCVVWQSLGYVSDFRAFKQ